MGETCGELGRSLYLRERIGRDSDGAPPPVDLAAERRDGEFVRGLIRSGGHRRATTCRTAAWSALRRRWRWRPALASSLDAAPAAGPRPPLFGEDQGRYLVASSDPEPILQAAHAADVHAIVAGAAGGEAFASGGLFSIPLPELRAAHEGWMPAFMGEPVSL